LTDECHVQRAVDYIQYLQAWNQHINHEQTLLMDEMAVYFEDAITQTVDTIGRQHVVMKSNGFASVRITVVASVWGYEKAPPMVIHNA